MALASTSNINGDFAKMTVFQLENRQCCQECMTPAIIALADFFIPPFSGVLLIQEENEVVGLLHHQKGSLK